MDSRPSVHVTSTRARLQIFFFFPFPPPPFSLLPPPTPPPSLSPSSPPLPVFNAFDDSLAVFGDGHHVGDNKHVFGPSLYWINQNTLNCDLAEIDAFTVGDCREHLYCKPLSCEGRWSPYFS